MNRKEMAAMREAKDAIDSLRGVVADLRHVISSQDLKISELKEKLEDQPDIENLKERQRALVAAIGILVAISLEIP